MRRALLLALATLSLQGCPSPPGISDGGAPGDAGPPSGPVHLDIRVDYRFDTLGFFDAPSRRRVVEEAAAAWGRRLRDDFEAIPAGTPLAVRDPQDPAADARTLTLDDDIDDVVVFVGAAVLDDFGGATARSFPSATLDVGDADLEAALTARYDGDDFEPWTGWITFDISERWFTDETLESDDDIPADRVDLYTNALHELGHILGVGTAPAFRALVEEGAFTGPRASALYGGPVPLAADEEHFTNDVRFEGERVLMDVSDPLGERFLPTGLDLAALADLGYELEEPL